MQLSQKAGKKNQNAKGKYVALQGFYKCVWKTIWFCSYNKVECFGCNHCKLHSLGKLLPRNIWKFGLSNFAFFTYCLLMHFVELPQQPGGFHYRLPFKDHKPTLWGLVCFVQSPVRLYQVEHAVWKPSLCLPAPHFLTLRWWAQKKTPREQESFMYGQKKSLFNAIGENKPVSWHRNNLKISKNELSQPFYSSVQQKIMGLKHEPGDVLQTQDCHSDSGGRLGSD